MVEVYKIALPKDKLIAMPEKERALMMLLGYAANQVNFFTKLVLLSSNQDGPNEMERKLSGGQTQMSLRILSINPNAKIPAIVDDDPPPAYGATPVSVFESGAILLYLAGKAGRFAPTDPPGRKELMEWLFWQVGNQGPMAGQLSHFHNYAPEGQEYALKRYMGEYERNLAVLENRLEGRDYILSEYSIADMLAFPWAFIAKPLGVSLDAFPCVAAWRGRIKERPAVRRAIDLHKDRQNRGELTAENKAAVGNASFEFG